MNFEGLGESILEGTQLCRVENPAAKFHKTEARTAESFIHITNPKPSMIFDEKCSNESQTPPMDLSEV